MQLINLFPRQLRAALRLRSRIAKGTPPTRRPEPYQLRPKPKTSPPPAPPAPPARPEPPPNRETRDGDTKARPKSRGNATWKELGRILCEALGESPENVRCIEVIADASDGAIVKITRFITGHKAESLGARMREFALVETEETHWIWGRATCGEGGAPTCSKCDWAVAPSEMKDHEASCWKKEAEEE